MRTFIVLMPIFHLYACLQKCLQQIKCPHRCAQVEADNQEQKDIADLEKRELRLTKEVKELEQGKRMSSYDIYIGFIYSIYIYISP